MLIARANANYSKALSLNLGDISHIFIMKGNRQSYQLLVILYPCLAFVFPLHAVYFVYDLQENCLQHFVK